MTNMPPLVTNILRASRAAKNDEERYEVLKGVMLSREESLESRMMQFQREGVRFGLRHGGRVLIGDEMGLGKTVQACALVKCYQGEWPVLVVTPSSLR
jgi:SWI/SNF-related matrix-associated actin-dependent regulator 1 of chromatin subfamily A